jgi:hypothetical protein
MPGDEEDPLGTSRTEGPEAGVAIIKRENVIFNLITEMGTLWAVYPALHGYTAHRTNRFRNLG